MGFRDFAREGMEFVHDRFLIQMEEALKTVKCILDTSKSSRLANEVVHQYDDKYLLVEFLAKTAFASLLTVFERLGLTPEVFEKLKELSQTQSVSLQLSAKETCQFAQTHARKAKRGSKIVREIENLGKITKKLVTSIPEHYWDFSFDYELFAFCGSDRGSKTVLQKRIGSFSFKTTSNAQPYPKVLVRNPIEVDISWIFPLVNDRHQIQFRIDKESKACCTPRSNPEVESALVHFKKLSDWNNNVVEYFIKHLLPIQLDHTYDLNSFCGDGIFVPILPIFGSTEEQQQKLKNDVESSEDGASLVVNQKEILLSYIQPFLDEHFRSLTKKIESFSTVFPSEEGVITKSEAALLLCMNHSIDLTNSFLDSVNYVENMLRDQLISAIGKFVSPLDFSNYMAFHNLRLFRKDYLPVPFCYSIRRPGHSPDGILSLELQDNDTIETLHTFVLSTIAKMPVYFSIDAATDMSFYGERYLHSLIHYEFSDSNRDSIFLRARARQFNAFILLVGTVIGSNSFSPKHAIIIQVFLFCFFVY